MSTASLLNSAISKLLARPDKTARLLFNSQKAIAKKAELQSRITDLYLDEFSFTVVGAFLQNIDLTAFTNDELKVLLNFDYSSIDSSSYISVEHIKATNTPFYDINNQIVNMPFEELIDINSIFKQLHSKHKNLNIEYFISYIIAQV